MQLHFLRIPRCLVCKQRNIWHSGMCRICCRKLNHSDLIRLDKFFDLFYPRMKQ